MWGAYRSPYLDSGDKILWIGSHQGRSQVRKGRAGMVTQRADRRRTEVKPYPALQDLLH